MDDLYFLSFHPALEDLKFFPCCLVENSLSRHNLFYLEFPGADDNSPGNLFSFVAGIEPQFESTSFIIFFALQFSLFRKLRIDVSLYDTCQPFSMARSHREIISLSVVMEMTLEIPSWTFPF